MKTRIMTKRNILWVAMAFGLCACTKDSEPEFKNECGEIAFSAHVSQTRVTNNAWDGNELVGIKNGETVKTYKVAADGAMTTEEEPYQWEGTKYELSAWTPLTNEPIDLTDQSTDRKFFDCDLLASNKTVTSKNVSFTFTHQMTRMGWELQHALGYTPEEINAAKVYFMGYGSVLYTNGVVTPQGNPDMQIVTRSLNENTLRKGEAMMVPGEMWGKALIKVEIGEDVFTYTPNREAPTDAEKNTGLLKPNTIQRYYLSVSKKGMVVDMIEVGSSIGEWSNEDADKGLIETEME